MSRDNPLFTWSSRRVSQPCTPVTWPFPELSYLNCSLTRNYSYFVTLRPKIANVDSILFNPLAAKLFIWNFHSLEVVSRWRDTQLQVKYSDLTKWRTTNFKSCWLMSLFISNRFKSWYVMCYKKCKKWIWTAPAVEGLNNRSRKKMD